MISVFTRGSFKSTPSQSIVQSRYVALKGAEKGQPVTLVMVSTHRICYVYLLEPGKTKQITIFVKLRY